VTNPTRLLTSNVAGRVCFMVLARLSHRARSPYRHVAEQCLQDHAAGRAGLRRFEIQSGREAKQSGVQQVWLSNLVALYRSILVRYCDLTGWLHDVCHIRRKCHRLSRRRYTTSQFLKIEMSPFDTLTKTSSTPRADASFCNPEWTIL